MVAHEIKMRDQKSVQLEKEEKCLFDNKMANKQSQANLK